MKFAVFLAPLLMLILGPTDRSVGDQSTRGQHTHLKDRPLPAKDAPPLPLPYDRFLTDVYSSGTMKYECFRWPALLPVSLGALLAFAEGRGLHSGACNDSDVEIVLTKSEDGGETWRGFIVVHSEYPHEAIVSPCPVEDAVTGKVFLFFSRGNRCVLMLESPDYGDTWGNMVDISDMVGIPPPAQPRSVVNTGGPGGIQLPNGRLLISAYTSELGCFAIYSDDHGKTWKRSRPVGDSTASSCQIAPLGLEEHDVKQLIMLSNTPSGHVFAYSSDYGTSWSNLTRPRSLDPQANCQSSIMSIPYEGAYLDTHLYLTQPRSTDLQNVSFYHSVDGGRTWKADFLLWSGPSAYSSLVYLVANYKVACLFECGFVVNHSPADRMCMMIFSPMV